MRSLHHRLGHQIEDRDSHTLTLDLVANLDLRSKNTLGLRAVSRLGATITQAEQLPQLFTTSHQLGLPVRVIGGGSNVVMRPTFEGVTAMISTKGRRLAGAEGGNHILEAAAGESWDAFVTWSIAHGYGGLENLAGIPGTVGAAPVQNIGAYGIELSEVFHSLLAYDSLGERFIELDRAACAFGYRDSIFRRGNRFAICVVRFSLPMDWAPRLSYAGLDQAGSDPGTIAATVRSLRARKLPDWRKLGNVGSFFKNPIVPPELAADIDDRIGGAPRFVQRDGQVKVSAAALVEACGFKGHRYGGVGVSEQHALVIVNYGEGTWDEVVGLACLIATRVRSRFGVQLYAEPSCC